MTEESDPFCMLLSACREMTGCSRLRPEMIVRMKKSSTAFSYCSEGLKCVIIRNKLLRTNLFSREKFFFGLVRRGRFLWKEWREHYGN